MNGTRLLLLIILTPISQIFAGNIINDGETMEGHLNNLCGAPVHDYSFYKSDLGNHYFSCKNDRLDISIDNKRPIDKETYLIHGSNYDLYDVNPPKQAVIMFTVPNISATCSLRCPNYLSISIDIYATSPQVNRSVKPRELQKKTIKATKDCEERLDYIFSHGQKRDKNTPPCVYNFTKNHQTFSTQVNTNPSQFQYSLRIQNLRKLYPKPGRLISFHIQGPIQFQWTSIEPE